MYSISSLVAFRTDSNFLLPDGWVRPKKIDCLKIGNVYDRLRMSPFMKYVQEMFYIKFFICPTNAHNSYKIMKGLKSFKFITVAPTCFGLHKPSSGSSHPVLCQSYKVDIGYIYRYLKLSVLWLHVDRAMEGTIHTHNRTEQNMKPQTSNNDIFNSYQHCNFSESQAENSLMMVYVNRNMLEQLL